MSLQKQLAVATLATLASLPAFAYEKGDFILRAGAASVDPHENASPNIVGVGGDTQLGITGSYMLTKNVGIEVLASTPFKHDIDLKGGPTVAEVKHLPPTVSVQYYFDTGSVATPYVGAGINYFMVLESSMTSAGKVALGTSSIDIDDSMGLALSAGVDVAIADNIVLNAAVWKIDVDTEANIGHGAVKIDVDVDPWVYMVGLGYKF